MASDDNVIFPSTSSDIQVGILFWIAMFGLVAASGLGAIANAYGAPNPAILFSVGGLFAFALIFRNADTGKQLRQSLGLKAPIPGFGTLMLLNGIGMGGIIYSLFTGQILAIAGMPVLTSIVQPFYNPYTASATSFQAGIISNVQTLFVNAYVAGFEEIYKVGLFKITSNWLYKRFGLKPNVAMVMSLLTTFLFWGLWHFFSWPALTLGSILMAIMYGFFFITGYFILGYLDITPPGMVESNEFTETLSGVVIYPVVGSHFAWNVLVATNGYGFAGSQVFVYSAVLFVSTLLGMYVVRRLQTQ